jgi:hypothetical protein
MGMASMVSLDIINQGRALRRGTHLPAVTMYPFLLFTSLSFTRTRHALVSAAHENADVDRYPVLGAVATAWRPFVRAAPSS